MFLSGWFRAGVAVVVMTLSACGSSPSPSRTALATNPPSATPRPSAAVGACAAVTTTTPIEQVPPACAALWAPYGVTKVPPANLTDATPTTKVVVNATNGVVSDAQVAKWIFASNRDSIWYRWAEANDQAKLLPRLAAAALYPPSELQAIAANESVMQPDCALFPTKVTVFSLTRADSVFFLSKGESVSDGFVFVGNYSGGCTVTATTPAGATVTIASYPTASITFFASRTIDDPLLGPLLFADGAGSCTDRGAPATWCRS
jgi:hypothetical protein